MAASSKTIASNPDFKTDSVRSVPLGQRIAVFGFVLYAAFAPHSIAGAEIALAIVGVGWLIRTLTTRELGLHRTRLDLPIWIFFVWTIASSLLSQEPSISIPKLQSVCVLFLFYITQAIVTKRTAILLVCVMILSGVVGSLFSVYDLLRGRGVVIESMTADSPLLHAHAEVGDAVWRINGRRVYSTTDIDEGIKAMPAPAKLSVSLISHGEHVERPGIVVNEQTRRSASPSGITGSNRTHRFRASGWTRHYETFSEILQILALLSLGLALAHLRNHGANARFKLAIAASSILALGIALTAMRTVLIAFVFGGFVIVLRAARGKTRLVVVAALFLVLVAGALVVWQTRAKDALALQDASVSLRVAVAKAGFSRILSHPVFGHGMDAVHRHWNEWGFPGDQMIGLHSTPLQLAFDRGLPALVCWLSIIAIFWLIAARAGRRFQDSSDTNSYGVLLGTTGAIAAFFASSLVNYNFGDAEVALVFWWLMGITVVLTRAPVRGQSAGAGDRSEVMKSNLVTMLVLFGVVFLLSHTSAFANNNAPTIKVSQVQSKSAFATFTQAPRKKRRFRKPDVIYYPTPPETVTEMLRLANIKEGEVLYDLGSGDGRIPIAAAKQFGIRAVGIEIDPKLVKEAEENARNAGVAGLVRFRNEDMFHIDISEANVVTLYLSEKLNVLLRPKLLRELRPGSRIISHDFRMGDWKPEQTVRVPWGKLYRTVYLWTVPARRRKSKAT